MHRSSPCSFIPPPLTIIICTPLCAILAEKIWTVCVTDRANPTDLRVHRAASRHGETAYQGKDVRESFCFLWLSFYFHLSLFFPCLFMYLSSSLFLSHTQTFSPSLSHRYTLSHCLLSHSFFSLKDVAYCLDFFPCGRYDRFMVSRVGPIQFQSLKVNTENN